LALNILTISFYYKNILMSNSALIFSHSLYIRSKVN
jgi:hypothetical protein